MIWLVGIVAIGIGYMIGYKVGDDNGYCRAHKETIAFIAKSQTESIKKILKSSLN